MVRVWKGWRSLGSGQRGWRELGRWSGVRKVKGLQKVNWITRVAPDVNMHLTRLFFRVSRRKWMGLCSCLRDH